MKRSLLTFMLLPVAMWGQEIPQYYNNIDFKQSKENVKQQIAYKITSSHQEIGYNEVWNVLDRADQDPENPENVLLIYGHKGNGTDRQARSRAKNKKGKGGGNANKWNREHVFAKSLASPKLIGSGNKIDAGSDAHNLRAADVNWNSTRNNRKFEDAQGFSKKVGENWYPGDEWKGDVARIIMYMYVRYGSRTKPNNIGVGGNAEFQIPDMPDVFLKWNVQDPPSEFEKRRNEEIFKTQQNRNPFIDNPYLATLIWGGEKAEDPWKLAKTLGTSDIFKQEDKAILYPAITYANEEIRISKEIHHLQIFDMGSRLVFSKENKTSTFSAPSQSGVYVVKMLDSKNNKVYTEKIIV
ncbi:MAG: endonuclease, partial [Bergeyella zoohelcum]|nr:endonuclease [Bergeyella zoohelcum]